LQLAQLAEQKDLQGLEAALEAAPGPDNDDSDESSGGQDDANEFAAAAAAMQQSGSASTPAAAAANGSEQAAASSNAASHAPPHLQAQPSLGAPPGVASAWHAWQQSGNLPPTPHTPVTPSRFSSKPGKLTVQDKDVLLVLTAFCKLASREAPGSSSFDSVLAQGKLLALEMLAKVREPSWGALCLRRFVLCWFELFCAVVHLQLLGSRRQ
jgi:hypothetical protein